MAHINLLPWREKRRAERQKRFLTGVVAAVLFTAAVITAVWYAYVAAIDFQAQRNDRLKAEIAVLDKKIVEIKEIERLKGQLLARMEVVENLQASRSAPVHFFNEVARTLPEGIYLDSVSVSGSNITVVGDAQSNARVSAYMRALEASPWFERPELVVIKTQASGSVRSSHFTLRVKQVAEQASDEDES